MFTILLRKRTNKGLEELRAKARDQQFLLLSRGSVLCNSREGDKGGYLELAFYRGRTNARDPRELESAWM